MKPRIYRRGGEWRCEFRAENEVQSNRWDGAGDTPAEAYESLVRLMGDLSWLLMREHVKANPWMKEYCRKDLLAKWGVA